MPDAHKFKPSIKEKAEKFKNEAKRCLKEAEEWPAKVKKAKDDCYAEIDRLKCECNLYETQEMWRACLSTYKQIAVILEKIYDGSNYQGPFDYKPKLTSCYQKIEELDQLVDKERLTRKPPNISKEEFQARESQHRYNFFTQTNLCETYSGTAIAIDGQSSSLYTNQFYRYLVQQDSPATTLRIKVLENSTEIHEEAIQIPVEGDTWEHYLTSDEMLFIPKTGLTAKYGLNLRFRLVLDPYHNFSLLIAQKSSDTKYTFSFTLDDQPLYDINFISSPPWQLEVLGRPPSEIKIPNTKNIGLEITPAIDDGTRSPIETTSYFILDQFIEDMKRDPLALVQYVHNEIETVDPIQARQGTVFQAPGISRNPLRTFLENQGSPWEQCSLLVYLLQHAGYQAQYIESTLSLPATYIEQLLFMQLPGEDEVLLDYPGVLFYDGQNWHTLFPWMKDIDMIEGYDLYSLMPDEYGNAERWLKHYLSNDVNILKHVGPDGDDTAGVLFVRFVEEQLRNQGLSLHDVGTHRQINKKQFNCWEDFPQPVLKGEVTCSASLLSIKNIYTGIKINISSDQNPTTRYESPTFPLTEISCGTLDIRFSLSSEGRHLMHLSFTDDFLKELMIMPFGCNDQSIKIEVTLITPSGRNHSSTTSNTFTIAKGTSAALCFHSGCSNARITSMFAEKLNKSTTSENKIQTLLAFTGALYFQKCSDSSKILAALHKVSSSTYFCVGLSKLSPDPFSINDLRFPQVDMQMMHNKKTEPKHPFRLCQEISSAERQYHVLSTTNDSANEHQVLREVYQDPHAISTVKLLQIAYQNHKKKGLPGLGFLLFTNHSFQITDTNPELARILYFSHFEKLDLSYLTSTKNPQWESLRSLFKDDNPKFSFACMTPGVVSSLDGYGLTKPSYTGIGTLAFSSSAHGAWISSDYSIMNGGFGSRLPNNFIDNINGTNWKIPKENKYAIPGPKDIPTFNKDKKPAFPIKTDPSIPTKLDNLFNPPTSHTKGSGSDKNTSTTPKADVREQFKSPFDTVADPVDVMTGAFYVDEVDLSIPGAFPLEIRRNYNSQNPLHGMLGYGWKLNLNPILFEEDNLLYAAEQDGTVIAYRRIENQNKWIVLPEDNPNLKNYTQKGLGSIANPFHAYIEKNGDHILYGTDGSKRVFHDMLLTTWSDHAGNALTFTYKEEQLYRIESSSGGLICFKYNYEGKISEVYTKDGRRVHYSYDFQGNLSSVTLPNNAVISYEYDSSHRIIRETKPHGRVLENLYQNDKVVEQRSPVGQQQYIVTSATFSYTEGATIVTDGMGGRTEYKINNNQIYKITDPEGYQTLQSWFIDEKSFFDAESETIQPWNSPGAYKRSLKSSTDKRGLTTDYLYDTQGNPKEITVSGEDLTGNGDTSVTKSFLYDANNLCILEETLNTKSITTYDSTFTLLPKRVEKYVDNTLISFTDLEYTPNGMVKSNNHCGTITLWEYDERDFPKAKIQQTGNEDPDVITIYHFNDQGQCVDLITADATEHNDYDIVGNKYCSTISLPSGKVLSKTYAGYDLNNELTWKQGVDLNDTVFFDYNAAGLLKATRKNLTQTNGTSIIPAGIAYTLYEYDACGRLTEKVDPLGNCTYNSHDNLGRLLTTTQNGLTTKFSYEAGGFVSSITSPSGATTTRSYTTNGLVKAETNPDGTKSFCTYDLFGRKTKVVNNDVEATIIYNDASFEEIRSVGDLSEIHHFDSRGNLVSLTDKAGFTWTKTYDALNRIKTETSPNGEITSWNYLGNRVICTHPSGEKTIQTIEAGSIIESQTLDINGTIISKTSSVKDLSQSMLQEFIGDIVVTTWKNTQDLPIRVQQGTKITSYYYDASGNCVGTVDGEGNISSQEFDLSGRLKQKRLPDGALVNYEYDNDSNLIAYHMPGGLSWKATYDCMRRKTSEWQESNGKAFQYWEYTYENGQLIQTQDPLKRRHTYGYDSYSRLITENVEEFSRTYTYDPRGLLASVIESGNDVSTVERSYDASGRLTQETISLNGIVLQSSQQQWTPSSRALQIGEHKRDFQYSRGKLKNLSANGANLSYEYAESGSLIKKTTPFSTTTIQYNESSLPRRIDVQLHKNSYSESLEWTSGGKLASFKSTYPKAQSSAFDYTARNQLKSVNEKTYSFDFEQPGCGIRTAAPNHEVSTNGLDELGRITQENFKSTTCTTAYDDMGQVILKDNAQFSWDPWGRLTEAISDKYEWKASYDALGRRLQTTYISINVGYIYTSKSKPMVTTSFYDPQHEFQEVGVSFGNKMFWKLYGSIACEAIQDASGNVAVLHNDMRNNLQSVITSKQVVWNSDYPTPYGPSGSLKQASDLLSYANSLTWQSKAMDPTGLIWMGARYYDPAGGRFISPDPICHPLCLDLYAYANGDPINNCDLDGRFASAVYNQIPSFAGADLPWLNVKSGDLFEQLVSPTNRTRRFDLSDLGFAELPYGLRIGFVNGIQNTFEKDSRESARHLSKLSGGYNIRGVYGANMGFITDLASCLVGLDYADTGRISKLHETWNEHFELNPDSYYLHFCHSRGAIDTRNALLEYPEALRKKIIVVAIAPAAYIYEHTCAKVFHYRAAASRDLIPYLDYHGAEREKHNIITLESDPAAAWHDHNFTSPTYANEIKFHITKYKENKGIYE